MTRNLNAIIRDSHAASRIRRLPVIGVDSAAITGATARPARLPAQPVATAGSPGTVIALRGPAPMGGSGLPVVPAGAPSTVAASSLDAGHRFAATKVTDRLGWSAGEMLHAACAPGRVVIRPGLPGEPGHQPVTFDARKQIRLGPTAVAALGLGAGEQVLAIATAGGELVLAGAAAVAEIVTGVIAAPAPAAEAGPDPVAADAPPRRSRVARRWQPQVSAIAHGG